MNVAASPASVRARGLAALRAALEHSRPSTVLDWNGYVASFEENLVPAARREEGRWRRGWV